MLRAKSYTVINLIGLSLSLACCIILLRYIHRELTVDNHANDLSSIIVPLRDIDGNVYPGENPGNKDYSVDEKYIEDRCKLVDERNSTIISNDVAYKTNLMAADTTFFHFFNYRVLEGNLSLEQPNNAILTETYAKKLFGKESPIGKNIYFDGKMLTVSGVIEQPVCKTTFNFDALVSQKLRPYWGKLNIELIYQIWLQKSCNIYASGHIRKRKDIFTLCVLVFTVFYYIVSYDTVLIFPASF
ncbi:ABC transporter permease [Bacteroides caecigallinarum]|uniref:ABC transporter permease n=1 Tax=Bacteroides caecigallinarum TaxID=1411144 RepID=UPI001F40B379|nr:ABC transporter permease [Bacteroides caecigallinarum]MCF2581702.1 ABC transporter permease [Bacteroides caecigallinarum]